MGLLVGHFDSLAKVAKLSIANESTYMHNYSILDSSCTILHLSRVNCAISEVFTHKQKARPGEQT